MLVGIMGGTFDPIHTGHLIAAETCEGGRGLDEVWLMPANVPPHKPNAPKGNKPAALGDGLPCCGRQSFFSSS